MLILLSVLDLICAIILILRISLKIPGYILLVFGLYLICKAFIFKDVASVIDGIIGFYMILTVFGTLVILSIAFAIFLLQKFAFTLVPSR